jgi:hypothetical protein
MLGSNIAAPRGFSALGENERTNSEDAAHTEQLPALPGALDPLLLQPDGVLCVAAANGQPLRIAGGIAHSVLSLAD